MNIIKKYLTLKKIIIFLGVVFVGLFFVGGCSFKYMDWQYYKFRSLAEKESDFYVADPKFFDEIQQENFKRSRKLSNGYGVESEETADFTMINNRIYEYRFTKMYFIDS
ncbi:hypothetical protein [Helicobacter trogontum]|uniref:Lipoprotein n=1 Tax=Helicobacter trogontum TaxID=50960 RepID=A0A4V6HY08_9HELI|nr:hypothetical protein [Helicobacter trogontum]TLD78742.1 hypothetical protein LS81_011065 [Helicobacter trogontum]